MKLYHYTAIEYMPSIIKSGICKGWTYVTRVHFTKCHWFTANANFDDQAWQYYTRKLAVRLSVEFEPHDPALVRWPKYAKMLHIRHDWFEELTRRHNGSRDWFVYRGVVPFAGVSQVHLRDEHRPLSQEEAKARFASQPLFVNQSAVRFVEITEAEALAMTDEDHCLGHDPRICNLTNFGSQTEAEPEIRRLKARLSRD